MPERNTPAYWEKFDTLSLEQRQQLEQEAKAFARGDLKKPDAPPDPAAATLPGDTPPAQPQDELGVDDTMFGALRSALPPEHHAMFDRVTKTVSAMQEQLEKVAPYFDPKFEQGLGVLSQDPILAARIKEIQDGNPFKPAALESLSLDPNAILQGSKLMEIDPAVNPEGFQTELVAVLKKAFEEGARGGYLKAEYAGNEKAAFTQRVAAFESDLNELMNKPGNEALRPTEKGIRVGDKRHPLNPFVVWLKNPALGDSYVQTVGMEAAYATYLAQSGKLQQSFKAVEERTRINFYKKVQSAVAAGNNLSNISNAVPANSSPELPGIDTARYLKDFAYAKDIFDRADDKTRAKLEKLRTGTLT